MKAQNLIDLFAEALEVPPDTLNRDMKIEEVEDWTSLTWLTIMALLDEQYQVELDAKSIRGFQKIGDIIDYIGTKTTVEG